MAIRWQTRSHWSHAALLVGDALIYEAWQGEGVRKKVITDWEDTKTFEVPTTGEQDEKIIAHAESKLGAAYDYRNVFRFVTRTRPCANDRLFCSEYVMDCFAAGGILLFKRVSSAKVNPGHLEWTPLALGQYEVGKP